MACYLRIQEFSSLIFLCFRKVSFVGGTENVCTCCSVEKELGWRVHRARSGWCPQSACHAVWTARDESCCRKALDSSGGHDGDLSNFLCRVAVASRWDPVSWCHFWRWMHLISISWGCAMLYKWHMSHCWKGQQPGRVPVAQLGTDVLFSRFWLAVR